MAKKSKLLTALGAHQGKDYEAEKKKKQLKEAEKRKRKRQKAVEQEGDGDEETPALKLARTNGTNGTNSGEDFAEFSDDQDAVTKTKDSADDHQSDKEEDEEEPEDEEDVPFSDLEASDLEDTVPHQRLTINNSTALAASRKRIAIVRISMPFHYHNSLVSSLPSASTAIPDANDDLTRELEFYRIAKEAVLDARTMLKKENIPFTRPSDYFAEMVKSDEHMGKVKKKMYDEAARKKSSEEARKLRDAKKFGKQVQIAKEQERSKEKRVTLDKIKDLKKKRKGQLGDNVKEDDNLFGDIDIEDGPKKNREGRERGPGAGKNLKREKRDQKYGFGGKKRHSKSGDAASTADMRGFSTKKMKGKPGAAKRPGKNRRAAAR